mmetsp:Transcript_15394/g.41203  ORF Transcript_15394/g.41203 Transcript_15394/m.41203 type:complete len:202 (+) Transcript_15394:737-1342(+)
MHLIASGETSSITTFPMRFSRMPVKNIALKTGERAARISLCALNTHPAPGAQVQITSTSESADSSNMRSRSSPTDGAVLLAAPPLDAAAPHSPVLPVPPAALADGHLEKVGREFLTTPATPRTLMGPTRMGGLSKPDGAWSHRLSCSGKGSRSCPRSGPTGAADDELMPRPWPSGRPWRVRRGSAVRATAREGEPSYGDPA